MSKNYASICVDREKVYGILNEENMSVSDLAKDIGVSYSAVKTWLNNGKLSKEFFDILVFSLGADPSEIKGKSSPDVGPNQAAYIETHSRTGNRKAWSKIDGMKFESLIRKNFGNISQFAYHVRMSDVSILHYISWGKIPSQYVERFALALNADPSEFVVNEPVIDILEERDGKIEKVMNLVEAGNTFEEAAEEAEIESVEVRPVDSSEVDALRARIEELEKRLAKYEKPKCIEKESFQLQSRLHDNMGATLEKEGIDNGFAVAYVENAIFTLADISSGNYIIVSEKLGNGNRSGFRRNHIVKVDDEKYSAYVHELYKGFIEQFNAR